MTKFPRPPYAHLPGQNARHDPLLFAAVKAATPAVTASASAAANPAWRFGLELLAEGFFWECHEVLEPVWLNAAPNSRERAVVQGAIQLANARLKALQGRDKAAGRLFAMSAGLFRKAAPSPAMGLDVEASVKIAEAGAAGISPIVMLE